jgi:hypothetical protein
MPRPASAERSCELARSQRGSSPAKTVATKRAGSRPLARCSSRAIR